MKMAKPSQADYEAFDALHAIMESLVESRMLPATIFPTGVFKPHASNPKPPLLNYPAVPDSCPLLTGNTPAMVDSRVG